MQLRVVREMEQLVKGAHDLVRLDIARGYGLSLQDADQTCAM
jgi:hypothetical protein